MILTGKEFKLLVSTLQQIAEDNKKMRECIELLAKRQQIEAADTEIDAVIAAGVDPVQYLRNRRKQQKRAH